MSFVRYKVQPPILFGDCVAPHPLLYFYYAFYYIAIFKNQLKVHVLLDFDSSKIKQALGSGMLQQKNNLYCSSFMFRQQLPLNVRKRDQYALCYSESYSKPAGRLVYKTTVVEVFCIASNGQSGFLN